MAKLDDKVRALIKATKLSYAATVNADGTPNLSPKGSIQVWDDDTLVFADIASPQTIRNLKTNPAIEINVLDPFSRRGYRMKGTAVVKREGAELDAVRAEMQRRFGDRFPIKAAVVIKVETVRELLSPSYQFDPDAKEADIRREWMAIYGVRPVEEST